MAFVGQTMQDRIRIPETSRMRQSWISLRAWSRRVERSEFRLQFQVSLAIIRDCPGRCKIPSSIPAKYPREVKSRAAIVKSLPGRSGQSRGSSAGSDSGVETGCLSERSSAKIELAWISATRRLRSDSAGVYSR